MILVILALFLALTFGAFAMFRVANDSGHDCASLWYITGSVIGGIGSVIVFIVTICLACEVSGLHVIDDKIAMYEEENTKIEEQIAATVQQYQEYETGIFTETASDSSITLVALYPDLKADKLVQSQIEIYVANNEKIKELKEQKINGSVSRWWMYFGG